MQKLSGDLLLTDRFAYQLLFFFVSFNLFFFFVERNLLIQYASVLLKVFTKSYKNTGHGVLLVKLQT